MKSLQHILSKNSNFHSLNDILSKNSNFHSLNDIIKENIKFRINRDTATNINIENVEELYLIRFTQSRVGFDIIKNLKIVSKNNDSYPKTYDVSGNFTIEGNVKYTHDEFEYDESGILYRLEPGFVFIFDILIHSEYIEQFKDLINELSMSIDNDENISYTIDEILDIIGVKCDNIYPKFKNTNYSKFMNNDIEYLKQYFKL